MASAWRRLFHRVITVPVHGLPLAVLAPEDQRGSDHQLDRLGAALELAPPALDKDPIRHAAVHRQEGGLARDIAQTRYELRSHPLPALADLRPAALDASPEPALADFIGVGAQRLHGFGIPVGNRASRFAQLLQERPQGFGSLLLDHRLLLSLHSPSPSDSSSIYYIV